MNFAFQKFPNPTSAPDFNSLNPWGKREVRTARESGFDGGDPGLQYRFWNQAENGYSGGSDTDRADTEVLAEEEAFLGLENLFACRKKCKKDQGGFSSLRTCIRDCKGKGLKKSALKTKEAETADKMADTLRLLAAPEQQVVAKSNTMIWVVVGIVALIIIGLLIYFLTRKKAEVVVA